MTLLEIYQTQPRSLLYIEVDDFDNAQWQDLTIHLGGNQTDAYDPEVIRHILPIIGNRVLWLNITSAQQFLYTAIFQNDVRTVDFILNTFENVRNGDGFIEGWEGYVEIAINQKLNHNDWSYAVLDRLLQHFDNKHGHGLLRCVQKNNIEVLQYILPHSDPSCNYFFAHRWTKVYDLNDIEQILQPHTNMFHALFGYYIERWVEPDDCVKAQDASVTLKTEVLNGLYDHQPLALTYRMGMKNGRVDHLTDVNNEDRVRLALLWCQTQPSLAHEVLKTVEHFEHDVVHKVVHNFRNHPDTVIPRLSKQQRQGELYNCAHHPEYNTFAQKLVEYGADPQQTLRDLNESIFSGFGFTLPKYEDERNKAVETLEAWISHWQARTIHKTLGMVGNKDAPSKM